MTLGDEPVCDWCDEPRKPAIDRMDVSNGAEDVILHLDLCADHASDAERRVVKAERVQRIQASMS
ncbi:MAG TPA: hypothetical protein VGB64_06790 [Actinomycetota bacterium]